MLPLAFGFGGPQDIAIIAVVVLLLFGGSKLAGFGKSLGEGIREFKKATKEDEDENAATPVMSKEPVAAKSEEK
jgi:sec-independent protein translocase protein TatA